jgi:anti-sigma regulatory factor (Ser/Thr protein kinase)
MPSTSPTSARPQILSRLSSDEFFNRTASIDDLRRIATAETPLTTAVIGPPQVGKTELLRTLYDTLFSEQGRALPIYYSLRHDRLTPERLAKDFIFTLLRQYLAFTHDDAGLALRQELTPVELTGLVTADEFIAIKELHDGLEARLAEGQGRALVRYALNAPQLLAARSQYRPVVMLDEAHWLERVMVDEEMTNLLGEMVRPPSAVSFILTGLERPLLDQLSAEEGLLSELRLLYLEPLSLSSLHTLVERWCERFEVACEHETVRLATQQLGGNLFYLRSLVAAASERKVALTSGADFERLYIDELLQGRLAHYFSSLVRRVAQEASLGLKGQHAAIEIVYVCAEAMASRAPVEFLEHRFGARLNVTRLLDELHQHELITLLDDHALPADDPVFCDWIEATHRRFEGQPAGEVKLDLLRRRIKAIPELQALSARRTLHTRIQELLERFDGQSVARSLFAHDEFLIRYGRAKYQLMLAGLGAEPDRIKLPQVIYVCESPLFAASREQGPAAWSCLLAYGFDDAIYDNDHETVWVIAVTDSPSAVTAEGVAALDAQLAELRDPLSSGRLSPRVVRWAISKMGFTLDAVAALEERGFSASDYLQLELLAECLDAAPATDLDRERVAEPRRPRATRDFDLAIPINDDKEIIAARVAEQIAKLAGFTPEEINQIKTALIEACLSLAASDGSPDGRIHQRYHVEGDQMTIIVSNSAEGLDETGGVEVKDDPNRIWRLEVLRSLVDQVTLTRFDDSWRVVLTKNRKVGE